VSLTVGDQVAVLPVEVFRSESDDALVVQLDTDAAPGRIRVYVNEGAVYDGDPEHDEAAFLITRSQLRHWIGEPVTEELLSAIRAAITHSSVDPGRDRGDRPRRA
jgi:hypothetical protein